MTTACLLVFGLSLGVGLAMTVLVRRLGRRWEVLDHPDGFRKVHRQPIPRIGGVAIFVAFFASLGAASLLSGSPYLASCLGDNDFLVLLGGAAAVLLIGLLDDIRGLRARWKLLLLTVVAIGMYAAGYRINAITNPFGGGTHLGWLALPITLFWFLGCMNAINFIDGLDGLATGVTIFVVATILVTSLAFKNTSASIMAPALIGAAAGFLVFNFHPASIYLGDSGSYLLGFLIACIGLRGSVKAHTVVALLVPVIAMGLPVFDTALAIIRRWGHSLPLSATDRQHIHHKLLQMGLSHRQAVLALYATCFALAAIALLFSATNSQQSAAALILLALPGVVVIRVFGWHELKLAKERVVRHFQRKKRGGQNRMAGHEAVERMRQAEHLPEVWQVFTAAADKMELERARLTLASVPETPPIWANPDTSERARPTLASAPETPPIWADLYTFEWARKGNGAGTRASEDHAPEPGGAPSGGVASDGVNDDSDALWSASLPLVAGGVRVGSLDVVKATNGDPLEAHVPDVLKLLSTGLAETIRRVHHKALSVQAQEALLAAASKDKQLFLWAPASFSISGASPDVRYASASEKH